MRHIFDRFTTGCARFAGRPALLMICILLGATGVLAFVSREELFISGANLTISVVTLLLLPILQATQNRDGAALQAKLTNLSKLRRKLATILLDWKTATKMKLRTSDLTMAPASMRRATAARG